MRVIFRYLHDNRNLTPRRPPSRTNRSNHSLTGYNTRDSPIASGMTRHYTTTISRPSPYENPRITPGSTPTPSNRSTRDSASPVRYNVSGNRYAARLAAPGNSLIPLSCSVY